MRAAARGVALRAPAVDVDAQPRSDPLAKRVVPRRGDRRQIPLEQVAHRDSLRREDPPRRQVVEPELRDVDRREVRPGALEQDDGEHREVEVVVLRDPVDVLGEARRPRRLVPRIPLRHGRVETLGGEPPAHRPVAGALRDRTDALARDVLDRLPEHTAGRAAEPGAADTVEVRLAGRGGFEHRLVRLVGLQRPRQLVELVEQLVREPHQLRRRGLLRRAAARRRAAAGGEPPLLDRIDILAFLTRLPELVTDEILRLDPRHSQTGASVPKARRPRLEPRAVLGEDLLRDLGHRAARLLEVELARRADLVDPLARHRRAERGRDCAAHRRDRVGVAAVVDAAEHRLGVVAARRDAAARARSAPPRSNAGGSGCARSAPAARSARRPSRTARTRHAASRGRRPASRRACSRPPRPPRWRCASHPSPGGA